jgi:glutathionylspermidine synthase
VPINEIGSDGVILVDQEDQEIKHLFKLYPYEWMMKEEFGSILINPPCNLIEPLWKTILSNKAMLVLLWELYPNHPYLLETSFSPLEKEYVKKPIYGREGSNIFIKTKDLNLETEFNSLYNSTGYVYQEAKILPIFDKKYAQVCSWIVGDDSAGICIREDDSPVIGNLSTFVPHYFF